MPVLPDTTAGYIRLFRKHALPGTRVKLKVMESWIFNVLFANSPHHFGFSKSSKKAHGPHLQTIHPTVFRFFCKGWNSLSAGLVKQIVFPKNLRRRFFFPKPSKRRCRGELCGPMARSGWNGQWGGFMVSRPLKSSRNGGISPVLRVEA